MPPRPRPTPGRRPYHGTAIHLEDTMTPRHGPHDQHNQHNQYHQHTDAAARVEVIAQAAVTSYGLVIDSVLVVPAGSRRIVRIAVDPDLSSLDPQDYSTPVPPVDLDSVAEASRAIDAALEEEATAIFGDRPYLLEIGSAGAERRLSLPRHYRANVGRLAEFTVTDAPALVGRIVAATPTQVTVRVEETTAGPGARLKGPRASATPAQDRVLALAEIEHARVRVEFGRAWDEPFETPEDDGSGSPIADSGGE
ncbi:MAG: hypothetical protein IPL37_11110 [Austwickia sp.]|nr:hypothetical protein [Austwickia sp.]